MNHAYLFLFVNHKALFALTFDPGKVTAVSRLIVVNEVVSIAVKIEHIQIPTRIQTTANNLPGIERGHRSPYLGKQRENYMRTFCEGAKTSKEVTTKIVDG